MYTGLENYTNEELLVQVMVAAKPTLLEVELAKRLERELDKDEDGYAQNARRRSQIRYT